MCFTQCCREPSSQAAGLYLSEDVSEWDAGRLGQGAPACWGLQLTHSASCHGCAGAGMPASCLGGCGSLYPCTCQSCTLCQGCWAQEPAAWHARTQGAGSSHQLPLGSPEGGWCKHIPGMVQLTITWRTGSSLPVCSSNRTTLTEGANQPLDSHVDGPVGCQNHLLSCSTDMLPVSHLFHPHCAQKPPQFSGELWQMKQAGRRKEENWLLA